MYPMYIGICMKFLELNSLNPYLNLAIEEYIFDNCREETFILWQNSPCVVIGKNQNPYAEVKIDLCKEKNVKIVRRITGGGAVYHDLGNVNYSFISPERCGGIDFEYFTKPVINALSDLGVSCELSGRNDIILSSGAKVSGNAQYSKDGRVLHHGTLLFNSDLKVLDELLNVDPEKLKSKAVRSARSRVANIKEFCKFDLSLSDFKEKIKDSILKSFSAEIIKSPDDEAVDKLFARNSSDEWIFNSKPFLSVYNIIRKKRFDFGSVELKLSVNKDTISSASITGDFFEKKSVKELEERLCGMNLYSLGLRQIDASEYILGMTNDDFIELYKG